MLGSRRRRWWMVAAVPNPRCQPHAVIYFTDIANPASEHCGWGGNVGVGGPPLDRKTGEAGGVSRRLCHLIVAAASHLHCRRLVLAPRANDWIGSSQVRIFAAQVTSDAYLTSRAGSCPSTRWKAVKPSCALKSGATVSETMDTSLMRMLSAGPDGS